MNKRILVTGIFIILFLGLLVFILTLRNKDNTRPSQEISTTPTPASVILPSYSPNARPVFKSTQINPSNQFRIQFSLPQDFAFPSSVDNVLVERAIDFSNASLYQKQLSFSAEPVRSGNFLLWTSRDRSKKLTINTNSGYVQYENNEGTPKSDPGGTTTTKVTQVDAQKIAEEFISSFDAVTVSPNTAQVNTLSKTMYAEYEETVDPNKIYFYQFSYNQSIRGVPIYYQLGTPAQVEVLVDIFGKVRSAKYFNIEPLGSTNTTTISFDAIRERVTNGDYTVNNTENVNPLPQSGNIIINSAQLAYFDDKINSQLFPIVVMKGTLSPGNTQVTLYTSITGK